MKAVSRSIFLITFLSVSLFWSHDAFSHNDLATRSGCMNCHQVEVKIVGPSLKAIAERYAGQDGASDYLAGQIKNGSRGVWGPIPMPPIAKVSHHNAHALADYILSLN